MGIYLHVQTGMKQLKFGHLVLRESLLLLAEGLQYLRDILPVIHKNRWVEKICRMQLMKQSL